MDLSTQMQLNYKDISKLARNDTRTSNASLYVKAILFLTGRDYDNDEATRIWNDIHIHWQRLNLELGRNIGFFVAALDYFENLRPDKDAHFVFVAESQLNQLLDYSTLDGMTSLYNHRTFTMLLERELECSRRKSRPLTLLMADIDNFKSINDSFGHLNGDAILIQLAAVLRENLRGMDIASRYGGEEFAIIFPETDAHEAGEIGERIRQCIEARFKRELPVTISIGIAEFPGCGDCAKEVIQAADDALYRAKTQGKNQLQYY